MSEPFYKITNTNAVALPFDEEIRLVRLWLTKRDHAARETLVKNYILFTVKTSKRKFNSMPEDDAVIVAHRGLLAAIDHMNPDRHKHGRLANLIPWYLRIEFRKFMRESEIVRCPQKLPKQGRYVSLDAEDSESRRDQSEHSLLDRVLGTESSAAELVDHTDRDRALVAAVDQLPERMRDAMRLVYFDGLTFASAGKIMNLTRERVRQLHVMAIEILRETVGKSTIFNR